MTKRARPIFSVNQYSDPQHQPWISIEYWNADPGMPIDSFGFDLPDGTSFERAKEIAEFMTDNLSAFTFTKA